MPTRPWSPVVRAVRDLLAENTGQYYNCCLYNLYSDGGSGTRYHADPDKGTLWDHDTAVLSVSATR
jgi:alkylated DNA repair dioxygenase AlkB